MIGPHWKMKSDNRLGAGARREYEGRDALRSSTILSKWFGALPAFVMGAGLVGAGSSTQAQTLPQGAEVANGTIGFDYATDGQLTVNQTSATGIANWTGGFNIGATERVIVNMPSGGGHLSRDVTANSSVIYGNLSVPQGTFYLINSNGILFGPGSQVDVTGIVASTLDIANNDFVTGNYAFGGPTDSTATVINQGRITVTDGGLAALVAPGVANEGYISANLGQVALASGNAFTLDLFGDGLVSLAADSQVLQGAIGPDGQPMDALVGNSGQITADGGMVMLTVNAAQGVVDNVISMGGIIQARSVVEQNGEIILMGGDAGIVSVAGTLDASGTDSGETGGTVKVLGEYIGLFDDAIVDVSGDAGGGTALIGGNFYGQGEEPNAKRTHVDDGVSINADAINSGDGGTVVVWADEVTGFFGEISGTGGATGGDGGNAEVSGKKHLDFQGLVNLSAEFGDPGTLLLDPSNITISDAANGNIANDGGDPNTFTSNADAATNILASVIELLLEGGTNVEVDTAGGTETEARPAPSSCPWNS